MMHTEYHIMTDMLVSLDLFSNFEQYHCDYSHNCFMYLNALQKYILTFPALS